MRSLLPVAAALALGAGCRPPANGAGTPDPARVTVADIITRADLAGKAVEVRGMCLGYSVPTVAQGSPPVTRSDWQLEDRGQAVWVSGALPPGCTSTQPADGPSTITALVAQDTLPGLGGQAAIPRRYLIRK
ncbi:MAG TPA: hypothetical protein VNH46_01750 [Gemmatimonadales bacterium]|nr:hypothetical protein [Gemmatimonadales bacterium]